MGETRRAFVTGASTGLGRATAMALARNGYDLAVTDLDTEWLGDLVAHPDLQGRTVVPLRLDLRSEEEIAAAFEAASERLGGLDLLVNNAGRPLLKPVTEVTWAEWDDVMTINLKGAYFLSQRFGAACIAEGRRGAIVSIASTHGLVAIPDRSVYGISKAGLIQMTRMLAIEWAKHDIRVNAIAPGTALTPSRERILSDPQMRAGMLARIPLGRFITPEQIADAVCYLASPAADTITGHTLVLDGGLTAY